MHQNRFSRICVSSVVFEIFIICSVNVGNWQSVREKINRIHLHIKDILVKSLLIRRFFIATDFGGFFVDEVEDEEGLDEEEEEDDEGEGEGDEEEVLFGCYLSFIVRKNVTSLFLKV